nr:PREDICTED: uncharacterized protein LOC109032085 [Bemisia tabaci]
MDVFRKHIKTCNSGNKQSIKCLDPSCKLLFRTHSQMVTHLEETHKIDLGINYFSFASIDEFFHWKQEEERNAYVMFVKDRGSTEVKAGTTHYYVCKFDVRARAHSVPKTPRKKFGGESLLNTDCPARMFVTVNTEGAVHVKYISKHNHELKFKHVKHYRWHEDTKNYINLLLEKEIPAKKVKEEIAPNGVDSISSHPVKEDFISTTQISKMNYEFKMKKRLNKNDAVSVQLLVQSLASKDKDSVLLYKPQGKPMEVGDPSVDNILSDPDLFVLGLQNDRQRQEMIKGCEKILVVDATHSTNIYDFYLVNLVVPDEYGVGYPVAHFLTNKVDTATMTAFYRAIKLKSSNLKVNSYITDDDPALYNSFADVFGPEPIHLLCKWHVKRSWKAQLHNKVKDQELRTLISKCLYLLIEEKNVESFSVMLEKFLSAFKGHCPDFCQYFSSYYCHRVEKWAMCFRNFDHGDTDTTMYCESLHNKIKTVYLGRKFNRRADDLVNIMLKLDDDIHLALLYKRLTEEPPLGKRHKENTRHMKGSLILDEDVILKGSEYLIKSQSRKDTHYTVNVISSVCTEPAVCYIKCDKSPCTHLCCHMYTCSCDDVNALCKHIHKVHSVIMIKNSSDNEDIDTPYDPLELTLNEITLFDPPPLENSSRNDNSLEKLLSSCKKQMSELQLILNNEQTHSLVPHVDKTLKLLVSECKGLISSATSFPPPPTMTQNSVPPNQKLKTQESQSLYRTTKKKGEWRKNHKLFTCDSEKTLIHSALIHTQNPKNFTKTIPSVEAVTESLFVEGPYEIKLYHVKSLDYHISAVDEKMLSQVVPDFQRGWLYDCVIYTHTIRISSHVPNVFIVDPCVSQCIQSAQRDSLRNINVSEFEKMFIPCNPTGDHWVLMVAYPLTKVIEFVDPRSNSIGSQYHQFIGHWVRALSKKLGTSASEWKVYVPKHTEQSDSHNCGVFVSWYVDQILNNLSINTELNTNAYRLNMYQVLMGSF